MSHETPQHHEQWMRRSIRLAMNGRGRVEPNPMVGCVIIKDGRVIGEGYHEQYGGPHAEPNALAACTESPEGATVYTTLEPCCHTNKKTPPCVPRLIAAKVSRVVVGCVDPDPAVNGRGIEQLRKVGIEVAPPVLEAECKQLLAPFIARVVHERPYVTLKWAETADGKVAGPGGSRLQISNAASTRVMHGLRARCDGIMVGIRTVMTDDPILTARGTATPRPLTRIVIDSGLEIPLNGRLVASAKEFPLLIYCHPGTRVLHDRVLALVTAGAELVTVETASSGRLSLSSVLADLGARRLTHLLVESGPRLSRGFITERLADRVWVFRSPKTLGDAPDAPNAFEMKYPAVGSLDLAGDTLTEYLNPASGVFFASERSADFVLAAGDVERL